MSQALTCPVFGHSDWYVTGDRSAKTQVDVTDVLRSLIGVAVCGHILYQACLTNAINYK